MRHIPHMSPEQRRLFWSKVDRSLGEKACWVWKGGLNGKGYGSVGWKVGDKITTYLSHRVAYFLLTGNQPSAFCCHTCDNPKCVNPAHIFVGTQLDNVRDRDRKGRGGAHKRRGMNNGRYTMPERTCRGERWHQLHDAEKVKKILDEGLAAYRKANPMHGKGENNGRAKLTEDDVRTIRRVYDPKTMPSRKLGRIYDVSKTNVLSIINHKLWPHVT